MVGICSRCRRLVSGTCRVNTRLRIALYSLLQKPLCYQLIALYAATFLFILPTFCSGFRFSIYYHRPNKTFSQEMERKENTERINSATRYLEMLKATKLHGMLGKQSHNETAVDVAINIITVSRNRHGSDSYEPKYLTQVVSRLLSQLHTAQSKGFGLHVHLAMCNVDTDTSSYKEAQRLAYTIPVHHRFNKKAQPYSNILEKEKQDYVFCLNKSLALNPRYVLLIEDDSIPRKNFFSVLEHVIHTRMDNRYLQGSLVPNMNQGTYIKLYHPERLLGFISLEFERIPELISIGLVFGTIATLTISNSKWGVCLKDKRAFWHMWLCLFLYFILLTLSIGRVHLIEFRRIFSPYLYTMVKAPECCTQAMLFPQEGGRQVAAMLQNVTCRKGFGKDIAIWRWLKSNSILAYMVQPNLMTHIGMYSTLHTAILDPFIL